MRLNIKTTNFISSISLGILCCFYFALSSNPVSATSSVSISTPATLDLTILPSDHSNTNLSTGELTITTNDSEGFTVMLSSDSSNLTNKHHSDVITSISQPTTLPFFPVNAWGIYLGAKAPDGTSNFQPLSTTPTEFTSNDLTNASGTYKLALAAKADTSLPAGLYSGQIIISVIATPKAIHDLSEAAYMQDITPEICGNSNLEQTYTLTDKRDGKSYKVAKLKDGNCWMQENLTLTLSTDTPLTPEDSDVTENWTPTLNTSTSLFTNTDNNGQASWCIDFWYYQWSAATAGSGIKITEENPIATDSICPKGWKLPLAGQDNNDKSGSFYKLISAYNGLSGYSTLMKEPLNFNRAGYIRSGAFQNVGVYGRYWSSRGNPVNPHLAYQLTFSASGGVVPSDTNAGTPTAMLVRCVVIMPEI